MENVVMVLTSKTPEDMFRDAGSGHWKVDPNRIKDCEYLLASRRELEDGQHAAFLIGRGLSARPSEPGRYVIGFEEFARVDRLWIWPNNHRNPIAYGQSGDLERALRGIGLSFSALLWEPFPREWIVEEKWVAPLTVPDAKLGIAKALGIAPECVEITIRA